MTSLLKIHMSVGNPITAIVELLDEIKVHIEAERDFDLVNHDLIVGTVNKMITEAEGNLANANARLE